MKTVIQSIDFEAGRQLGQAEGKIEGAEQMLVIFEKHKTSHWQSMLLGFTNFAVGASTFHVWGYWAFFIWLGGWGTGIGLAKWKTSRERKAARRLKLVN